MNASALDPRRAAPAPRCPICQAETVTRWRPFCSKRCADVDLGRWMTGHYAVADDTEEPPEYED